MRRVLSFALAVVALAVLTAGRLSRIDSPNAGIVLKAPPTAAGPFVGHVGA